MATRRHIRELAEGLLSQHNITTPPVDVFELARRSGIAVASVPAEPSMSGFLMRDPRTRRHVVGVNSSHHEHRQRFTVAHELGHFFLHDEATTTLHVDRQSFQIQFRDEESGKGTSAQEIEANRFAAELLMPREMLSESLGKRALSAQEALSMEDLVDELSEEFAVSPTAMSIRLQSLGILRM